jgi:hypothetical protein
MDVAPVLVAGEKKRKEKTRKDKKRDKELERMGSVGRGN